MTTILTEAVQFSFYKDRMDQETFNELVALDPTPTKKYGRWIVETYLKGIDEKEHPGYVKEYDTVITEALRLYDHYKNKNFIDKEASDILKFKSFFHFVEYIDRNVLDLRSREQEKQADKEVKILYRDKSTILLIPLTHAADCKWGRNSHWCTATSNSAYYPRYAKGGTLYIRRYFDETGALITDEGYQLYIPNSNQSEMSTVECRDMQDDTINEMDDFYRGIPREIIRPIKDAVEDMGGLNARQEIQEYWTADKTKEGWLIINNGYVLYNITDYDMDIVEGSDDETTATFILAEVGRGTSLHPSMRNLQFLKQFNLNSSYGIYIEYTSRYNCDDIENNARNRWHQAERSDDDDSVYDTAKEIKRYLSQKDKGDYEYIILDTKEKGDLDRPIFNLLQEHFAPYGKHRTSGGYEKAYEEMEDQDEEGNIYIIYYRPDLDWERPEENVIPVSTPAQREYDKQQDLPYGL
jgi:hypothetical protein